MRRRPDQPHHPALHIRQQHILLRLVEPVNLVNKQNSGLPRVLPPIGRRSQHSPHIRHIRFHPAQPLEFAPRLPRDDLRQRSLSRPRRPVKYKRLDAIRLNRAPQQLSRPQDMFLSRELVQVPRPHARRQRLRGEGAGFIFDHPCGGRLRPVRKQIMTRHVSKVTENRPPTKPEPAGTRISSPPNPNRTPARNNYD